MAKNRRSSDDDSDFEDASPSKRQKTPKRAPPLYKAEVIETADATSVRVSSSTADLDEGILERMKKCLARANHPETPEAEAKAALHLASKLMKTYNVTTAEILAHETPEAQRTYAGSSKVAIKRCDGDKSKKVQQSNYIGTLCVAMESFFGCKSYTTSGSSLKITFYGIAENTVGASAAFEMVYNLMVEWARPYKGTSGKNSYCYGVADELLNTAEKEKVEEEKRAKKAEEEEKAARLKQEQADDKARLDRLHELQVRVEDEDIDAMPLEEPAKTPEPTLSSALLDIRDMYPSSPESAESEDYADYESWDGFSDQEDDEPNESGIDYVSADFDDDEEDANGPYVIPDDDIDKEIEVLASTIKPTIKQEPDLDSPLPFRGVSAGPADTTTEYETRDSGAAEIATADDPTWKSHMQLIKFRETTEEIAKNWLQDQGKKLRKGRKRSGVKDWDAFRKGQKDSKKIDVRRKTIQDHSKAEEEQSNDLLSAFS